MNCTIFRYFEECCQSLNLKHTLRAFEIHINISPVRNYLKMYKMNAISNNIVSRNVLIDV